jgi:hypothetical protein
VSTYYYLANPTRKEYIECENECSPKEWPLINGKGCQFNIARKLLIHGLWDSLIVYDDIHILEDPPWEHDGTWVNIWSKDDCKDDEYKTTACRDCLKEFHIETIGTVRHTMFADMKCAKKHRDDE